MAKPQLIPDLHRAHTFYSVWLAAAIALFAFLQGVILPLWAMQLSPFAYAASNSVLATLLFVARLIQQGPPEQQP